jgi:putative pyruvate formate lyase activating enzyme
MELTERCELCPRKCGANRLAGKNGFCGGGKEVKVARASLHFWEEPCISGEEGSGTVFFSGCTMRCVFCQNREISRGEAGKLISIERLAEIFLELQGKGANNINLVTPIHYAPQITAALDIARKNGLHLPIVWNTGGWELPESVEAVKNYSTHQTQRAKIDNGLKKITITAKWGKDNNVKDIQLMVYKANL